MAAAEHGRATVADVAWRMSRIEEDFKHGIAGLHRRLDELNYVHPETFALQMQLEEARRSDLERRVSELESNGQWLWRTIGGILLTALLLGLLAAVGLPK